MKVKKKKIQVKLCWEIQSLRKEIPLGTDYTWNLKM